MFAEEIAACSLPSSSEKSLTADRFAAFPANRRWWSFHSDWPGFREKVRLDVIPPHKVEIDQALRKDNGEVPHHLVSKMAIPFE